MSNAEENGRSSFVFVFFPDSAKLMVFSGGGMAVKQKQHRFQIKLLLHSTKEMKLKHLRRRPPPPKSRAGGRKKALTPRSLLRLSGKGAALDAAKLVRGDRGFTSRNRASSKCQIAIVCREACQKIKLVIVFTPMGAGYEMKQ